MRLLLVHWRLVALLVGAVGVAPSPAPGAYWPGVEWRTATPESQGLDSQALASAIDQVRQQNWGTHSLLVIRHGFVVTGQTLIVWAQRPGGTVPGERQRQ